MGEEFINTMMELSMRDSLLRIGKVGNVLLGIQMRIIMRGRSRMVCLRAMGNIFTSKVIFFTRVYGKMEWKMEREHIFIRKV